MLLIATFLALLTPQDAAGPSGLIPDPTYKGEPAELLLPDSWVSYFPTAKVGDYAEYSGGGRRRDQVVEVTPQALVVARVVANRRAVGGRTELRFRYTVGESAKKKLAAGKAAGPPAGKGAAKGGGKPAVRSKSGSSKKSESPREQILTVGDKELRCLVREIGKITTWTCPEVPFDGLVKKTQPDGTTLLEDFGRGK